MPRTKTKEQRKNGVYTNDNDASKQHSDMLAGSSLALNPNAKEADFIAGLHVFFKHQARADRKIAIALIKYGTMFSIATLLAPIAIALYDFFYNHSDLPLKEKYSTPIDVLSHTLFLSASGLSAGLLMYVYSAFQLWLDLEPMLVKLGTLPMLKQKKTLSLTDATELTGNSLSALTYVNDERLSNHKIEGNISEFGLLCIKLGAAVLIISVIAFAILLKNPSLYENTSLEDFENECLKIANLMKTPIIIGLAEIFFGTIYYLATEYLFGPEEELVESRDLSLTSHR